MVDDNTSFDESFWAYVYLLISDDVFITREARLIREISNARGHCHSVTMIAKKLQLQKPLVHKICNELEAKGYISFIKNGRNKIVKFNEDAITKGMKLPYTILGETL